jgi:hypothetical protein
MVKELKQVSSVVYVYRSYFGFRMSTVKIPADPVDFLRGTTLAYDKERSTKVVSSFGRRGMHRGL